MGINISVKEGENIESAIRRFKQKEQYEYKRWTKKRYGYFEKPSELRRKRKKMAKIWKNNSNMNTVHLNIGLKELFSRSGPNNAAGK